MAHNCFNQYLQKMNRRKFITTASIYTSASIFLTLQTKHGWALPLLLSEENGELKKYLLNAYSVDSFKYSTAEAVDKSISTMFWITLDPDGRLSNEQKAKALDAQRVKIDDLYKACYFKENPVEDRILSAHEWAWAGGAVALGIFSPPSAAIAIGLAAVEKGATWATTHHQELQKEAQRNLCAKTISKYYIGESNVKRFLKQESVEASTKIPFKKEVSEIVTNLPDDNKLKRNAEAILKSRREGSTLILKNVLKSEIEYYDLRLKDFERYQNRRQTQRSREIAAEQNEFESKERQAGIYLSQLALKEIFDEQIANDFQTLATSLNTIYTTYKQCQLTNTLTFAATANYVSAGLAIVSLFSASSGNTETKQLFESIQRLTKIVIDGFNAIHKGQLEILKNLERLTDIVIEQGIHQDALIRRVKDEIEAFRADYNNDQYSAEEKVLSLTVSKIDTLFNSTGFNAKKVTDRKDLMNCIFNFYHYGNDTAANHRIMSGYTMHPIMNDLVNKFDNCYAFEYLVGTIPAVHKFANVRVDTIDNSGYNKKIPNPYEWARAFYLYYQTIFAARLEGNDVRGHISTFLEKGRLIKNFISAYSSHLFIQKVSEIHKHLAERLLTEIENKFQEILSKERYYLCEYLIATCKNVRRKSRSLYSFNETGNAATSSFIVRQGAFDANSVMGYYSSFNLIKSILILETLGAIEPQVFVTDRYSERMSFYMKYSALKFHHSQIKIYYTYIPHDGAKELRSMFVFGKNPSELAKNRAGTKATDFQSVVAGSMLPDSYWKIYPGDHYQASSANTSQMEFIDYFRNEIIIFEARKRLDLVSKLINRESQIMQAAAPFIDQLNATAYLLGCAQTLLNFKKQNESLNSYLERSNGIPNCMKPMKPATVFAKDIFSSFVSYVSNDLYNDYAKLRNYEKSASEFQNIFDHEPFSVPTAEELNFTKYQIVEYAKGNVRNDIEQQLETLFTNAINSDGLSNYNVDKIISECEIYLKHTT